MTTRDTGESLTLAEYAARCRERCSVPAQGHDGAVPCGGEHSTEDGSVALACCGRHWGPVLDSMGDGF
jgi:hypothetical protein